LGQKIVTSERDEVGGGCGAGEGGEVASEQGGGEAEGDEQEFVDDVDDAVGEFDVLDFRIH
jgi:hypothetical protein